MEQALQANYSHKKDGSERGGYHRGRGRRGGRGNHSDEQSSNHADDSEGNGRRSNEARGRGRGRGRQGRYDKSQIPCYLCQRFLHDSYDSWYNTNNDGGEKANLVDDEKLSDGPTSLINVLQRN